MSTNTLGHRIKPAVQTGLTATGSTQASALALTNNTLHEFTSVPSSAGAILPVGVTPSEISIFNDGASALSIYPPTGGSIDAGTANAAVALAAGSGATFWASSPSNWYHLMSGSSASTPGGISGQIQYDNAGAFGGFTASGDATIDTSTGAVTVTKTGGVAFAASATTDTTVATNITSGTLSVNRFNGGTSASSSTFLRGDGTWVAPSGGSSTGLTPTGVKTSTYTTVAGDYVPCDTTSGAFAVTLVAAPADKTVCAIEHVIQGSTNAVTMTCGTGDVFNKVSGPTSLTLPYVGQVAFWQYEAVGAMWNLIASSSATFDTGDYLSSSVVSGSAVSIPASTYTNVTSLSLPPGDWDVCGVVDFLPASLTCTLFTVGSSTSSGAAGGQDSNAGYPFALSSFSTQLQMIVPTFRYNLATTTTVYMVARSFFTAGTLSAYGTLRARRLR